MTSGKTFTPYFINTLVACRRYRENGRNTLICDTDIATHEIDSNAFVKIISLFDFMRARSGTCVKQGMRKTGDISGPYFVVHKNERKQFMYLYFNFNNSQITNKLKNYQSIHNSIYRCDDRRIDESMDK